MLQIVLTFFKTLNSEISRFYHKIKLSSEADNEPSSHLSESVYQLLDHITALDVQHVN